MTLAQIKSATTVLAAGALFAAATWAAWGDTYQWLRWALLLGSAAAGAIAPRLAIQFAVLGAPLLPIVSRALLGCSGLSLAEHLVVGLLPTVLIRAGVAPRAARAPISRGQLVFVAVVVTSFLRILHQYDEAGVGPIQFIAEPLRWSFAPTLGHFAWDRLVILRHTLVFVEAGLWWAALQAPGVGLRSTDLRRSLIAGALLCSAVGIAQSRWHFAPGEPPRPAAPALVRITATLPDNNTLGVYLALLFPSVLLAAAHTRRRGMVLAAAGGTLGYPMLAAASRSALIGLSTSAALAAGTLAWRPRCLGATVSWRMRRVILSGGLGLLLLFVAAVTTITAMNLGRAIDYPHAASLVDVAVLSLNLRRPANEILADRLLYWHRAIALWRLHPLFGIGIGRFSLWKTNPPDGIVAAGPGGTGPGISVAAAQQFNRWVNADGGINFEKADVLAGDTIESPAGRWGPVRITGRWSPTQLTVEEPVPPGERLDFVIRHPPFDPGFRAHAHRSALPFWTTAHNFYLELLSELGLVGVSAFLALLWTVCSEAQHGIMLGETNDRRWVAAVMLGVIALLVASLAQDPLTVREVQYVFWALVALMVLRGREAAAFSATDDRAARRRGAGSGSGDRCSAREEQSRG